MGLSARYNNFLLLDAYEEKGYVLFRFPNPDEGIMGDIVRVRSSKQMRPGRYLALPEGFAIMDPEELRANTIRSPSGLELIASQFRIAPHGLEVKEEGTQKAIYLKPLDYIWALKNTLQHQNGRQSTY